MYTKEYVASIIDHTILKPEATEQDVIKLCAEAKKYGFASICINPCHVKLVREELKGSNVKTCTVIGFPLGANTSAVKAFETKTAIEDGAEEVDMVINVGMLKAGNTDYVKGDIEAVVKAAAGKALVKVIIEACLLTDEEKSVVSKLSKMAGADFVKTSTGFSKWGAKAEDVRIMRAAVGNELGVKASGGIHTFEEAAEMIEAGASRLGTSASIKIVE